MVCLGPIKVKYPGLNSPLTMPNDEPMTVMEKTTEEVDAVEERLKNIIVTRPSLVTFCYDANLNSNTQNCQD